MPHHFSVLKESAILYHNKKQKKQLKKLKLISIMKKSIYVLLTSVILMSFSTKTMGQSSKNIAGTYWGSTSTFSYASNATTDAMTATVDASHLKSTSFSANENSSDSSFDMNAYNGMGNRKNSIFMDDDDDKDSSGLKSKIMFDEEDFLMFNSESEEDNTEYFAIEKSIDDEDYCEIGFLKTTQIAPADYNGNLHSQANAPLAYYRIKRVENTGRIKYSKKLIIIANDTVSMRSIKVAVGATNKVSKATFTLAESNAFMVSVANANGAMVLTQSGKGEKGTNTITLDTKKMVMGSYHIYITDAKGLTHVTNFIKD